MTETEIREILLSYESVVQKFNLPDENLAAFYYKNILFAIIHKNSQPLKIDLKIDANLAKLLKEKYESVANAPRLNSRIWVEILATGQISDDDLRDLLRHSYEFAK